MALDVDLLLDRRRLKRRLIVWRTLAVVAGVIVVLTALHGAGLGRGGKGDHIERLTVNGIITEDRKELQAVRHAGTDNGVKALIVSIDSPGGSVAGGEALYRAISGVAAKKPVVAVMHGLAASAGYMISLPANRIFASESTITGSIGVLMETGEVSGLLGKIGITTDALVSGPLKDQPSYTKPLSPEGREVLQGLVMDMYDQFVSMVATSRHMDPNAVRALADGRAYTGRQALKLGLIDAIGDEQDARVWLETAKGLPKHLPVEDISTVSWTDRMLTGEFSPVFVSLWKTLVSQSVMLDLPMALWHR
jgi:protease IV